MQTQLDVYGEVVTAAYHFVQSGARFRQMRGGCSKGSARRRVGTGAGDHGIWEIRGARRHYAFSKVMCWAALDSLIKLHECGTLHDVHSAASATPSGTPSRTRGFNAALNSYVRANSTGTRWTLHCC